VDDSMLEQRKGDGETSAVLEAATAMPLANINRQKALARCSGHRYTTSRKIEIFWQFSH
jgi:hypothetical protein